jgi:hypothetical protein
VAPDEDALPEDPPEDDEVDEVAPLSAGAGMFDAVSSSPHAKKTSAAAKGLAYAKDFIART